MANQAPITNISKSYNDCMEDKSIADSTEDDMEIEIELVKDMKDILLGKLPQFKLTSRKHLPNMDLSLDPSLEMASNLEDENHTAVRRPIPRNKKPTKGSLFRKQNGICQAPTFIDGDGSVKPIFIYENDTSADVKDQQEQWVPRFGHADKIDSVIIGAYGTVVSKVKLNQINWSGSSSSCVNKVMSLVFDRETMATSNLTGKESNAHRGAGKPKKEKLNPEKVADITDFIMEQLPVAENEVRKAIVNKCGDETQMKTKRERVI